VAQKRVGFVDEQHGTSALVWRDLTAATDVAAVCHRDETIVLSQQVLGLVPTPLYVTATNNPLP
jgi:hypothetical protein